MSRLSDTKQLTTTLPNLVLWSTTLADRVLIKDASNLPFLTWPNQRPCTPANLYMLALRERLGRGGQPLSRRGKKGGTIGAYAGKISQLIRYCHHNNIDFLELNDSHFTNFIHTMRKERSRSNVMHNQKNENTITDTGRVCLEFLGYIGRLAGRDDFVGEAGTIRITIHHNIRRSRSGSISSKQYINHHSFSAGEGGYTRAPISDATIQKLHDAIDKDSTSRFVNQRRHLQLSFLEYLGPRRGELAEVTIEAVYEASAMAHPVLKMSVFKKGKKATRNVPITNMLLNEAKSFIKNHRARTIKKFTKSGRKDHGLLFISHTNGEPLSDTTLTNEIHHLRKAALIEEAACAHMFRHAFCTNLFVTLFERHSIKDPESFEFRILSDKTLLTEILGCTGHASIEGLLPYIHIAYRRLSNISDTISAAHLALIQKEFNARLELKLTELETGIIDQKIFINDVRNLIAARSKDIDAQI